MNNLPHAALFDLDGVIIDTEGIYTEIWSDIERAFPTGIDNFAVKIKGSTLRRILDTWFPSASDQEAICGMLRERELSMDYPIFAGVEDFLQELLDAGIPAAIVTSSNAPKMERLFSMHPGLRRFFEAVLTDADVKQSKPSPECYLKAADRLGADPSKCIVFEDSFSGLQAGRASGARVVALATTNPRESLVDKADYVIDSFEGMTLGELLTLLR